MRRISGDDRGVAMAAVVGVVAVTSIIALTVGMMTLSALSFTTMTRASVQATAAAEAGIDTAEASLRIAGNCEAQPVRGVYSSTTAPLYSAQVSYRISTGTWTNGCPIPTATEVRVVALGTADAPATGGASARDEVTLEAVFTYIPAAGGITASGGAIHTSGTNGLNNLTVTTASDGGTAVRVRTGSFTCQGNRTIEGDLIIENGSVEMNGCIVEGDVHASGYVAVNSGTNRVDGDVIAAGIGTMFSNQYAGQVGPGSRVRGDMLTNGPVYINGNVDKSVIGAGSSSAVSTITPSAKILQNLTLAGTLTSWVQPCNGQWNTAGYACGLKSAGVVGGTVSYSVSGLVVPPRPAVSPWAAYTYKASDWTSAGFTEMTWTGDCNVNNYAPSRTFINSVMAATTPVVVNATACPLLNFSTSAALTLNLRTDVAFIGSRISIEGVTITSSTPGTRVWFIVPGATPNSASNCGTYSVKIDNSTKVQPNVAALVYTPGCAAVDATTWRGQFYSSWMQLGSSLALDFVPVGLPGLDLEGGVTGSASTPGTLGTRTSLRELAG